MDERSLLGRLDRLEEEVVSLRSHVLSALGAAGIPAGPPSAPRPPIPARPAPERPPSERVMAPSRDRDAVEENVVGTWFSRLGALAVLLGAAFAFKYAIDQGIIGPAGRVLTGMAAGLGFVLWGEWALRRGWARFAQAVTAGGLGLFTLSLWAAFHLYGLLSAPTTFLLLAAVVGAGGMLSARHDSEALAALAALCGFLNPVLIDGAARPAALLVYVAVLDIGVVWVASRRRWRAPQFVAFAGSWLLHAQSAPGASVHAALGSVAVFFAIFTCGPALRAARRVTTGPEDVPVLVVNAFVSVTAGLAALDGPLAPWRGLFVALLATAHLALALIARGRGETFLSRAFGGIGVALATVAVPVQLQGPWVGTAWAAEGVALLWIGRDGQVRLRGAGAAVAGLGVWTTLVGEFALGAGYHPPRLLLSAESAVMGVQVAVLAAAAVLLRREPDGGWQRRLVPLAGALAGVSGLAWISFEASAHYSRVAPGPGGIQATEFALSAIWGLYAALAFGAGIASRRRPPRTFGVWLLGATMVKMGTRDLWLLGTLHRTVGFLGLGAVLLLCSLGYHRYRDSLKRDGAPAAAATPG